MQSIREGGNVSVGREYCCCFPCGMLQWQIQLESNHQTVVVWLVSFQKLTKEEQTYQLCFLFSQQLCLSPPDGGTSSGLTFVAQGGLRDFFLMFLCGMRACCIHNAAVLLCRALETFSEAVNYWLYSCHMRVFPPDLSVLKFC